MHRSTLKTGELVYPPHSFGFEAGWRMPTAGGTPPNLPGDSFRILGHQDPNWNLNSFELDSDLALALKNGGNAIDAINPDLSKFKARGGKLLLYHGWADPGPAPENTINYLNAVNKQVGGRQQRLDETVPASRRRSLQRGNGSGPGRLSYCARELARKGNRPQ